MCIRDRNKLVKNKMSGYSRFQMQGISQEYSIQSKCSLCGDDCGIFSLRRLKEKSIGYSCCSCSNEIIIGSSIISNKYRGQIGAIELFHYPSSSDSIAV